MNGSAPPSPYANGRTPETVVIDVRSIGLNRVADSAPDFIAWAWGINGFASVMSASTATLLAIEFGFTAVVLLALGFYAAAAVIAHDQLQKS